ncbi:MAG: hypothetical protein HGA22_10470, partial [Clostridiales bacterium]|nr:hypothetical protein [Clostridiales bacterium]
TLLSAMQGLGASAPELLEHSNSQLVAGSGTQSKNGTTSYFSIIYFR